MTQVQLQELQKRLWNIANDLRGKMGADEFRDYILGLIFYKYLSEKVLNSANQELKEEGLQFSDLDVENEEHQEFLEVLKQESLENMDFFLEPTQLFHTLADRVRNNEFILDELIQTLKAIEQSTLDAESSEDFAHLFEGMDLTSIKLGNNTTDRNELISKVLIHLDAINFNISNTEADVLGDAYEYLIGEFASGAGKKAGEFYTPQTVSTLLARIVTLGKNPLRSIYDPTCGSGSLLLRVKREVGNRFKRIFGRNLKIYLKLFG